MKNSSFLLLYFFHLVLSFSLFSFFFCPLYCKVLLKRYLKGLKSLLATSDKVLRWSLSSDTVKFYICIFYLFLGYSFHLFLCWSSSDTLLSSDWVLGHRPSPFQCKLYLWDQLTPAIYIYIYIYKRTHY